MYIHIYIHPYIYIHIYIYVYLNTYIFKNIYVRINKRIYTSLHDLTHMVHKQTDEERGTRKIRAGTANENMMGVRIPVCVHVCVCVVCVRVHNIPVVSSLFSGITSSSTVRNLQKSALSHVLAI